jgi:hypothetical protein
VPRGTGGSPSQSLIGLQKHMPGPQVDEHCVLADQFVHDP